MLLDERAHLAVVSNQLSNSVSLFDVAIDGLLEPIDAQLAVSSPTCAVIASAS